MNVALFHHYPLAGGAPRVLREYVANSPQHEFTLYTRQPESPGLMSLDPRVAYLQAGGTRGSVPLDSAATREGRRRLAAYPVASAQRHEHN